MSTNRNRNVRVDQIFSICGLRKNGSVEQGEIGVCVVGGLSNVYLDNKALVAQGSSSGFYSLVGSGESVDVGSYHEDIKKVQVQSRE